MRAATLRNDILPVLCGSAFKHVDTELLMDYVGALLPSPVDVIEKVPSAKAPLRVLAWKVSWDKRKGWMTFVRVYSGKLSYYSEKNIMMTYIYLRYTYASIRDNECDKKSQGESL